MSRPYSDLTRPMDTKDTIPLGTDVVPPYADPHGEYGVKNPSITPPVTATDEDDNPSKKRRKYPPSVEFDGSGV